MKSILLHVTDDAGLDERLQVALDMCRAHDAHLSCLQFTPYNAYVAFDPLGGIFTAEALMAELREREEAVRTRIETQLGTEDVRWDWVQSDGDVVALLTAWSALADLLVISHSGNTPVQGIARLADEVALSSQCPVLVVPPGMTRIDASAPVVIGWNATPEAARALRMALPHLRKAAQVHLVTVGSDNGDMPQLAASTYLSRHGVSSQLHALTGKGLSPEDELLRVARETGAGVIVMGAWGRSRLREALLGGVTRSLLDQGSVALMMMH